MTRLLSTVRWNLALQFRYGFYFVSAFFILVWVGFLRPLPHDGRINFGLVLAGLMVLDLTITNFYYMGTMVLLEKGEGTLTSLVVTPLRAAEYLLAKMLSLMLLALLEGTLLAILINGFNFNPLPWFAGLLLLSGFYTLLGFAVIARYRSLNESLLPSALVVAVLVSPILNHFGLWRSFIFYLHPVQPALILLRWAFMPVAPWEIVYGLLGSLFWLAVAFALAHRVFNRAIVQTAGG